MRHKTRPYPPVPILQPPYLRPPPLKPRQLRQLPQTNEPIPATPKQGITKVATCHPEKGDPALEHGPTAESHSYQAGAGTYRALAAISQEASSGDTYKLSKKPPNKRFKAVTQACNTCRRNKSKVHPDAHAPSHTKQR